MRYILITIAVSGLLIGACNLKDAPPATETLNSAENSNTAKTEKEQPQAPVSPDEKSEPRQPGIETIYTDLTEDKCVNTESNEEEEWSIQSCKGVGGYSLLVSEGDLRQTIDVVSPGGRKYELDLWRVVSSAFSTVGDKAEWRVVKEKGKTRPVALIVRYNVNEDPENTEKITSYLTVTKITPETACVTDIVKPVKNANEKARILADSSSAKPCLGSIQPAE